MSTIDRDGSPRSVGEALAAADAGRQPPEEHGAEFEEFPLDGEEAEPVEEAAPSDDADDTGLGETGDADDAAAPVESEGHDPPAEQSAEAEHRMDDLRSALGASEPAVAHEPSMTDLRNLLLDPEWRASVPAPDPEPFGPMVQYGDRLVPVALIEMMRAGVIKGWS
jgi:hypothetical protein